MPDIELPMDLMEYDAILRSIEYAAMGSTRYAYGSTTAQILSDKFEDCNMPLHAALFRLGHVLPGPFPHPLYSIAAGESEEIIAAVHVALTSDPPIRGWLFHCRGILLGPDSTLHNYTLTPRALPW